MRAVSEWGGVKIGGFGRREGIKGNEDMWEGAELWGALGREEEVRSGGAAAGPEN